MANCKEYITLSRLQALIKGGIDVAHPLPYWLTAEISELKVSVTGHCYIDLIEKGEGRQSPRAKMRGVIWSSSYSAISQYFTAETSQRLGAGINVLVKAVVTYHELYGISLQIIDIDASYTLGDMERQRQQTINRLRTEGVFDMNREIDMPMVIQRLAIISSPNAAGYQDFINELFSGRYKFEVKLFEALMQGAEAERSIIAALDAIMDEEGEFDAVVIIRGGGSQSDLGCFDNYEICNNIAQFPLPVITGIGHDKDSSVADLVATLSLKTPTAVAVHLVNALAEFEAYIDEMMSDIRDQAMEMIDNCEHTLHNSAMVLNFNSREALNRANLQLHSASMNLRHESTMVVERLLHAVDRYIIDLKQNTLYVVDLEQKLLCERGVRIKNGCAQLFEEKQKELSLLEALVAANDPILIMDKGFAIVSFEGQLLESATQLSENDAITITLMDGSIESIVKKINLKH